MFAPIGPLPALPVQLPASPLAANDPQYRAA